MAQPLIAFKQWEQVLHIDQCRANIAT